MDEERLKQIEARAEETLFGGGSMIVEPIGWREIEELVAEVRLLRDESRKLGAAHLDNLMELDDLRKEIATLRADRGETVASAGPILHDWGHDGNG